MTNKTAKIPFNLDRFLELRNKNGIKSTAELHYHIGKKLESTGLTHGEVDKEMCTLKTLQRMESEGKATSKTLDLICKTLEVGLDELTYEQDSDLNKSLFNSKIENENVELIDRHSIKKYISGSNKRIYLDNFPSKQKNIKKKVLEITKLIDKYSRLADPFTIVSNQSYSEDINSHLLNRSDVTEQISNLLYETGLYLYAAKIKYYSYWPFPHYEFENYSQNFKKQPFYNDIYYPKKKTIYLSSPEFGETYDFDPNDEDYTYKIIPIKLHYAIFIFSENPNIGSISYETEACYRITNDIAGIKNEDEEDEILLGQEIKGNYKNALEFIQSNENFPENYLDHNSVKIIFRNDLRTKINPFNLKDYSNDELNLANEILHDKNFYKIWDNFNPFDKEYNAEIKNNSEENLNYLTRMEYLENSNLKKIYFDNIQTILKYGHWISISKKDMKKKIIESGFAPLIESIDFKIEEAQMDQAYEDGYFEQDNDIEISKHEHDAQMDQAYESNEKED